MIYPTCPTLSYYPGKRVWCARVDIRSNSALSGTGMRQGVLAPADAEQAVNAGVDGIVVSNHGGRQARLFRRSWPVGRN